MLSDLLNQIYCLSYTNVIGWCAVFALVMLWQRKCYGDRLWLLWGFLLLLWIGAVLYATIWSRGDGGLYRMDWIPFHSYRELIAGGSFEILRSNFMNVLLFLPAGILLGAILPENRSRRSVVVLAALVLGCFSLCIELMQLYLEVGHFEADDILHNVSGGVLGTLSLSMGFPQRRSYSCILPKLFIEEREQSL